MNKMLAARKCLLRRLAKSGALTPGRDCTVRLDRLRVTSSSFPKENFRRLPGFRPGPDHWVKSPNPKMFQAYGRVQWFENESTGCKFSVEYEPKKPWLKACRTTIFADDKTGLQPGEVFRILELLPDVYLRVVEIAFDFTVGSIVDSAFVRRHGLFGKAQPLAQKNGLHYWGKRKSAKLVRSYFKSSIGAQRVELELHSRFLRQYGIHTVFDFSRLVKLLPRRHVFFARLDWGGLAEYLERHDCEDPEIWRVLQQDSAMGTSLRTILRILRHDLGIANAHRFLTPHRVNKSICVALKRWASTWEKREDDQ